MKVQPIEGKTFGAVVTEVKLAEIDAADFAALYRTWLDHALLVLPGQHLTRDEQVAFAKRFGGLELEAVPISNLTPDGTVREENPNESVYKVLKGNCFWHQDSTYMPVQAKGAVFSCQVRPSVGGGTAFADLRAAYDALNPALREKIEPLSAQHSLHYSQAKVEEQLVAAGDKAAGGASYTGYGMQHGAAPLRPLVKVHPETGRKSVAVGRHAFGIPGLAEGESEALIDELTAFACQGSRVYEHDWTVGDVVIWDNRCLAHKSMPWTWSEPRVMLHTRLAGHPVSEFAAPL